MNRLLLLGILLSCLQSLNSCSKNVTKLQELSKSDQLFNQVKNEPKFVEYLSNVEAVTKVFLNNAKSAPASDTAVLNDKSKTFDQKYDILKYTGLDSIKIYTDKSKALYDYLYNKYPILASLTKEESKAFFKMAITHYKTKKS